MVSAFIRANSFIKAGMAASGWIRKAPRQIMNASSLVNNSFTASGAQRILPIKTMDHLMTHHAPGITPPTGMKAWWSFAFPGFAKRRGLQANHIGADGDLTLSLSKLKHTSII